MKIFTLGLMMMASLAMVGCGDGEGDGEGEGACVYAKGGCVSLTESKCPPQDSWYRDTPCGEVPTGSCVLGDVGDGESCITGKYKAYCVYYEGLWTEGEPCPRIR
jgi:hypothetical protein